MEVTKVTQLKSVADAIAKKLATLLFYPKILIKTWLRIQLNIVFFPFRIVPAVIRITSRENRFRRENLSPSDEHSETESSGSPVLTEPVEPRSEDVVKQVKKLRNCVAMSIDHFTGRDFFWDIPILEQKVKRYTEALRAGDPVEIAAAKKAVKEHPVCHPKPKSRAEYNRLMEEARRGPEHVAVFNSMENTKPVINMTPLHHDAGRNFGNGISVSNGRVSNVLKPKKNAVFHLDNEETLNIKQEVRNMECQRNKRLSLQNKRLRNQLMTTNNRLEEIRKSSNSLLQEVSKLNEHFSKLTNMNAKIITLENEIGEGKKLLYELEEERNDLRHKLLALEQLIKEEESYLNDLSCECGDEEIENVCDSHYEL